MKDARIRRVENGFIVTVGEGENGDPAPQYVARDFDQLCTILKDLFGDLQSGETA